MIITFKYLNVLQGWVPPKVTRDIEDIFQVIREMLIKTIRRYHAYLLEWVKLKSFNMSHVDEDMEELDLSYTAHGNVKCTTDLQLLWKTNSFLKVKYTLTIWPSRSTFRYLPERNDSICLHKDMYVNFYNSFICKSQKTRLNLNVHQ